MEVPNINREELWQKGARGRRNAVIELAMRDEEDDGTYQKKVFPKSDMVRARLRKKINQDPLFSYLREDHVQEVLDALFYKRVPEREVICEGEGELADCFYIVDTGQCQTFLGTWQALERLDAVPGSGLLGRTPIGRRKKGATLISGDTFGEISLKPSAVRETRVVAGQNVSLWVLDRGTCTRILRFCSIAIRKKYKQLLLQMSFFEKFHSTEVDRLCDVVVERTFERDSVIYKQGTVGTEVHILIEGEVSVLERQGRTKTKPRGKHVQIASLQAGQHFGQGALLCTTSSSGILNQRVTSIGGALNDSRDSSAGLELDTKHLSSGVDSRNSGGEVRDHSVVCESASCVTLSIDRMSFDALVGEYSKILQRDRPGLRSAQRSPSTSPLPSPKALHHAGSVGFPRDDVPTKPANVVRKLRSMDSEFFEKARDGALPPINRNSGQAAMQTALSPNTDQKQRQSSTLPLFLKSPSEWDLEGAAHVDHGASCHGDGAIGLATAIRPFIEKQGKSREYASGQTIVKAGAVLGKIALLLKGTAVAMSNIGRPQKVITRKYNEGDYLAEVTLADEPVAQARDIIATADCTVLWIDPFSFRKFIRLLMGPPDAIVGTIATIQDTHTHAAHSSPPQTAITQDTARMSSVFSPPNLQTVVTGAGVVERGQDINAGDDSDDDDIDGDLIPLGGQSPGNLSVIDVPSPCEAGGASLNFAKFSLSHEFAKQETITSPQSAFTHQRTPVSESNQSANRPAVPPLSMPAPIVEPAVSIFNDGDSSDGHSQASHLSARLDIVDADGAVTPTNFDHPHAFSLMSEVDAGFGVAFPATDFGSMERRVPGIVDV